MYFTIIRPQMYCQCRTLYHKRRSENSLILVKLSNFRPRAFRKSIAFMSSWSIEPQAKASPTTNRNVLPAKRKIFSKGILLMPLVPFFTKLALCYLGQFLQTGNDIFPRKPQSFTSATSSISIFAPRGRAATWTVLLAGRASPRCCS